MLAGFAAADITPPVGAPLNGFIARTSPSTGVDAALSARALWIEECGVTCLVISLDVLGLSPAGADRLVRALSVSLGIPEDHVVLASTHTHSGPMTVSLRGLGPADEAYVQFLESQTLKAASHAASAKRPAKLHWGTAPVSISINRRQVVPEDGTVVLGRNPEGPTDTWVRVMHLRGGDAPIVLFEHACHPYCIGGDCNVISPDFWGHAAAALAADGYNVIYMNGCAGNLAPQMAHGGPKAARETGRRLADAVMEACRRLRSDPDPTITVRSRRVQLPHDAPPSLAEVERDLDKADRTVRDEERTDPVVREHLRAAWAEWLSELKRMMSQRAGLPPLDARVSVARIGRGAIVALPGEIFYEIGERIARRLVADPACVAAYCHGYVGYVPAPESYAQGGYEVDESHRYVGLWRVSPHAASLLEDCVFDLWKECGGELR